MAEQVVKDIYTVTIPPHRRNVTLSPYCEACKNGVVYLSSLEVRQFTQTGKLPNVCKTCNKEFLKVCRTHIRNLTERETLHACEFCGRSFIHAGNLKKHKLLHSEPGVASTSKEVTNGEVPETPKNTENSEELGLENHTFVCKECDCGFSNDHAFTKHCQFHKNDESNSCLICNQLFETLKEHEVHNKTHEGKKEFICNICPAICLENDLLKNHCLSTHEKDHEQQQSELHSGSEKKVFVCNLCDKTFIQRGAFFKHSEQHAGRSPFTCKECNKMFTSERRLNSHQSLHDRANFQPRGNRYNCKTCGKHFKIRKTYMKHCALHGKAKK